MRAVIFTALIALGCGGGVNLEKEAEPEDACRVDLDVCPYDFDFEFVGDAAIEHCTMPYLCHAKTEDGQTTPICTRFLEIDCFTKYYPEGE